MDCVITLKKPKNSKIDQGTKFEVHFEKARCLTKEKIRPFLAIFELVEGKYYWTTRPLSFDFEQEHKTTQQIKNCI